VGPPHNILKIKVNGQYVALNGVVDTEANTITAHSSSFSPFVLASLAPSAVPEPGTLALLALGAGALWTGRRRRPRPETSGALSRSAATARR